LTVKGINKFIDGKTAAGSHETATGNRLDANALAQATPLDENLKKGILPLRRIWRDLGHPQRRDKMKR